MTNNDDELPKDVSPPAGQRPDRRRRATDHGGKQAPPKAVGHVDHDDLGNAVWNWHVEVPRRREEDPTIDLLECLDVPDLALEDDEGAIKEDRAKGKSFNPYDKG